MNLGKSLGYEFRVGLFDRCYSQVGVSDELLLRLRIALSNNYPGWVLAAGIRNIFWRMT